MRKRTLAGSIALSAALVATAAPLSSQGSLVFHRYDTASIGAPRSIVSADFNRDGFPDVALGGTARASIGILFHHGLEDGDEGQRFKPLQDLLSAAVRSSSRPATSTGTASPTSPSRTPTATR